MCHDSIGIPSPSATWRASSVLPVPGSPLISSGRSSAIAQLTASISGGEAMYPWVPWNWWNGWREADERVDMELLRVPGRAGRGSTRWSARAQTPGLSGSAPGPAGDRACREARAEQRGAGGLGNRLQAIGGDVVDADRAEELELEDVERIARGEEHVVDGAAADAFR